jgi:hypothetical protein
MKIAITITHTVDIDEQHTVKHPLLQQALALMQSGMTSASGPAEVVPANEAPMPPVAISSVPEPVPETAPAEPLRREKSSRRHAGNGEAQPPVSPANTAEVEAKPMVPTVAATPGKTELSVGERVLLAARKRLEPQTVIDDALAANLAQARFAFDKAVGIYGVTAAKETCRSVLPAGVKLTSIEALAVEHLPAVIAALEALR